MAGKIGSIWVEIEDILDGSSTEWKFKSLTDVTILQEDAPDDRYEWIIVKALRRKT